MSYKDELESKFKVQDHPLYPHFEDAILRLDLTNICNNQCIFCPNHKMDRNRIIMKDSLSKRLIREAAELGIKKVGLFMTGEPFVQDNLAEIVSYTKECGFTFVFITTNGSLPTKERLAAVLDAGIDSIKFSINAGTREGYQMVHGHDDFDTVIENLKFAHEYKQKSGLNYRILSGFVVTDLTKNEVKAHCDLVRPYVDDMLIVGMDNFAGYVATESQKLHITADFPDAPNFNYENKKLPCAFLFNSICISPEGYLTACTNDMMNGLAMVDVNTMSLRDAWYSDAMVELRKKHIDNDVAGTQCYDCMFNEQTNPPPLNQRLYDACRSSSKMD